MNITFTNIPENANAITHSGIFHADEVIATVILSKVFDHLTIMRTFKVPDNVNNDAIIYDIGQGVFDHHQPGGNGTRENGIPYAAAGLIWKAFGPKLVENSKNPKLAWELVDKKLIEAIDAYDNGTIATQGFNFSNAISAFNPVWNSKHSADEAFLQAVNFADTMFTQILENAMSSAEAEHIVEESIEKTSDGIMVLEKYVPWLDFIFTSQNPKAKDIFFVVFPSLRGGYNFQCVPDSPGSKGQKKPVPKTWLGLKGSEFQNITGVPTADFCHPAGFIGGAETQDGAIELAKIALEA